MNTAFDGDKVVVLPVVARDTREIAAEFCPGEELFEALTLTLVDRMIVAGGGIAVLGVTWGLIRGAVALGQANARMLGLG